MKRSNLPAVLAVAVVAFLVLASTAQAELVGQLGILDLNANGGNNPATGSSWQAGDQYRLVFVSSATRNAASTDIADYNAFVQGLADSSSLGLTGATWKVIASTEAVNARVNTGTTGTGGEAIFLMDGTTVFANNYADLWNGTAMETTGLYAAPDLDENGVFLSTRVFAGTTGGGATVTNRWLGTTTISNNALRVETGLTQPNNANRWMQQYNAGPTSSLSFYALSDPLTVMEAAAVPEPGTFVLVASGLLALAWFHRRRTH